MKETEAETRSRILDECAQELGYADFLQIEMTEQSESVKADHFMYCYENAIAKYHSERLKVSLPTEEEMKEKANSFDNTAISGGDFIRGAKWIIELLTKGEK